MTSTPFLALQLRGKKDAILARQRARRVARLLGYDLHEQACIAAGAFVIACQALAAFAKPRLCFLIEQNQLHVYARDAKMSPEDVAAPIKNRLAGLFNAADAKTLLRLCKPLPAQEAATDQLDLGWLVCKVEETACNSLFDEIVKQNQETLTLLHELRLYHGSLAKKEEKAPPPQAA